MVRKLRLRGAPTVSWWVKYTAAVAWVTAKAGIDPQPGNFHMPWRRGGGGQKQTKKPKKHGVHTVRKLQ